MKPKRFIAAILSILVITSSAKPADMPVDDTVMGFLLCTVIGPAGPSDAPTHDSKPIFLVIVLDTSPTSAANWKQLKVLACQAVDYLQPAEKVAVLSAQPGKPSLHITCAIESPAISSRQNLRSCIADIGQAFFLFRSDVSRALAVAFNQLKEQSEKYACCLLVLSDGNLSDNQIHEIRRLAAAYKACNWPICFTATRDGNRNLFVAASQSELELAIIYEANLAQWLEKVRHSATLKSRGQYQPSTPTKLTEAKPVESPQPPSIDQKPQAKAAEEPLSLPQTAKPGLSQVKSPRDIVEAMGEPNATRPSYLLPVYPVPQEKLSLPEHIEFEPPTKPQLPARPEGKPKSSSIFKNKWISAVAIAGTTSGLILTVILLTLLVHGRNTPPELEIGDQAIDEKQQYHLTALSQEQHCDLGEEQTINTLFFGVDAGSAIPIVDNQVESQHFKIYRSRGRFRIKNLAHEPILVNGTPLNKGQKQDLLLPATIQLSKNTKITLIREIPEENQVSTDIEGEPL